MSSIAQMLILQCFSNSLAGPENAPTISTTSVTVLSYNTIIAVVTSMTVFVIMFFTFGFVCGCLCRQKQKQSMSTNSTDKTTHIQMSQPTPVYEEAVLQDKVEAGDTKQQEQDPEMTKNVAYGPLQSTNTTNTQV